MKHQPPDAFCRVDSALAFREELLKCRPALQRYARTFDDADDLVQETMARALEHETVYTAQGAMNAWLYQILKNTARDFREQRKRYVLFCEKATTDDYDHEALADELLGDTDHRQHEAQIDAMNLAALAGQILPAHIWQCLELTLAGHTSNEIAAELGISAAAVRQSIARGRKALKALRAENSNTIEMGV